MSLAFPTPSFRKAKRAFACRSRPRTHRTNSSLRPSSLRPVNASWGSDVQMSKPRFIFLLRCSSRVCSSIAAQPWSKDASQWTAADVQRLLAELALGATGQRVVRRRRNTARRRSAAALPGAAEAGMAGSRGANGWQMGWRRRPNERGGVPSLPVTVRWDSALPVRQALLRLQAGGETGAPSFTRRSSGKKTTSSRVIGLVPAGGYRSAGQLPSQSRSDDDGDSSKRSAGSGADARRIDVAVQTVASRARPPLRPKM